MIDGIYTTGQIAKLCMVAPRTVAGWFDKGLLKGYRLPGTGQERRVPRANLLAFLTAYNMPIPNELKDGHDIHGSGSITEAEVKETSTDAQAS